MKLKEKQKIKLPHTDFNSDPAVSPECCNYLLWFILVYTVIIQSWWLCSPLTPSVVYTKIALRCAALHEITTSQESIVLCPGDLSQLVGIRERRVRVWSGGFAVHICIHPGSASQFSVLSTKLTSGKDTRTCAKLCQEQVAQVRSEEVGKDLPGRMDLLGRLMLAVQSHSSVVLIAGW